MIMRLCYTDLSLRFVHNARLAGIAATAVTILGAAIQPAEASGFYVREQSTSALASANAGSASDGSDPSNLFFNPATIIDNSGSAALTGDARLFIPKVKIKATAATSPLAVNIIAGGDSGSMADPAVAPSLFASVKLNERFSLGVGFTAPFAVVIDANPAWAGRFQLLETDIRTTNVNPVLAYRVSKYLTVATGLSVQHYDSTFKKMELFPHPTFGLIEAVGFLKGEDTGFGMTAGLLFTPSERTRIGIGYRSRISHVLRGTAGLELAGVPVDGARFKTKTPDIVTASLSHNVTDRLSAKASFEWANWSQFTGFDISFSSGRPNEVRAQKWKDTFFGALGLSLQTNERTSVSAGVSHGTAVSTGAGNTISPDGDRTTLAVGVTHKVNDGISISGSYAHMFFKKAPINITNTSGTLIADFHSRLDIFGLKALITW